MNYYDRRTALGGILRVALLCVQATSLCYGAGCRTGKPSELLINEAPHVDGRWTGRLVAVTVHDRQGRDHPAAALRISQGPRMPYAPGDGYDSVAAERTALLTRVGIVILAPNALSVPIGSWVSVDGKMMAASMRGPAAGTGALLTDISRQIPWEQGGELMIRLRQEPRIMGGLDDDGAEGGPKPRTSSRSVSPSPAIREPVDLSTPQAAGRAFGEALRDGDEIKLRALMYASGLHGKGFLDIFARWTKSSVRLERAARSKYGETEAERLANVLFLPPAGPTGRSLLENLPDAEVQVEGDRATILVDPVGRVDLRRRGGQWRMAIPEPLPPGKGPNDTHNFWERDLMKAAATAQDEVAERIEAGRYATPDDAAGALERAVLRFRAKNTG